MKHLFAVIALVLVLAGVGVRLSFPDLSSDVPVLYWVTDANPARAEQVNRFHQWLVEAGHFQERVIQDAADLAALVDGIAPTLMDDIVATQPDLGPLLGTATPDLSRLPVSVKVPVCEMRVDAGNRNLVKQTIHSVSGVAGDVMDLWGAAQIRQFQSMGVLADVTEDAGRLGFGLDATYPGLGSELTVDGRQYAFPCNVQATVLLVNDDTFRRYGFQPPPTTWTIDQFEAMGVAFCEKANAGRDRREVFFVNDLKELTGTIARSLGAAAFNETLTACVADHPGYVRALELVRRWIYELRIAPTPDDAAALTTSGGFGGAPQLLVAGSYAMTVGGRYDLVTVRGFQDPPTVRAVHLPHGGFPNTGIGARSAVVYADSDHHAFATLFMAYLASPTYNEMVVADADALPPNPAATRTEAFLRPPDHPNEWSVHAVAAEAAEVYAIGSEQCPFVPPSVVVRETKDFRDRFLIGQMTAQEAAAQTQRVINVEIDRELERKPGLRAEYQRRMAIQERIDRLKAAGEPIPEAMVLNPFLRAWYRHTGRLLGEEPAGAGEAAR